MTWTIAKYFIVAGAALWIALALISHGKAEGIAETQVKWDADKLSIQAISNAAIAAADKDRDTALANNEAIQNAYIAEKNTHAADTANYLSELRSAYLRLAAGRGSVSQSNSGPEPATAAPVASESPLGTVIAARLAECDANESQLSSLIAEVKPQL